MTTIEVPLPEDVFSTLRKSPQEVARDVRAAAAVQWYAEGLVSQGKGAELAGLRGCLKRAIPLGPDVETPIAPG